MTDVANSGSQVPATQQDVNLGAPEGLEDFGTEDRVMPMLRINHQNAKFVDALSNQEYDSLDVILLGLVKQRVLWPAQMKAEEDSEPPLCRSYNFKEGHPARPEILANGTEYDRFPWDATQFTKGESEILPCTQCPLKDWGSHPTRDAPWCSEQHTFALVIPQEDGNMVPCLFQIQRSGLKPSRQYLSSFANANQPLFTVHTKITLEAKKMGSNPFAVPKFSRSGAVDEGYFPEFSTMYRNIREYLQTPRTRDEDEADDGMTTEVQTPVAQAPQQAPTPPAPAAPAPAAEQAAPAPQQAAPAAPQQPAEAAPAPQAAPAPAAPQAAPQPAVEETPEPAPQPAPAPATPSIGGATAPGAPTPEPAAASTDDDEIPF